MSVLKKAERKLGRFAIQNLTLYLVVGQAIALFIGLCVPGFLGEMLLIPAAVVAGHWWLLFSFVLTPPSGNPLFAAFTLYLLYFMGSSLEAHWGTFRYNIFVLIGYLMTVAAAFAFPFNLATNGYITGSIFLAFAYLFPDYELFLFFVLRVKIKWLAALTWLFYGYQFATGGWSSRLLIVAAITNFLAFFGTSIYHQIRYGHRRTRIQARKIADRDKPIHVCTTCGMTDKTHRDMDFRYCTKCDPPVEYCADHLAAHPHVGSQG